MAKSKTDNDLFTENTAAETTDESDNFSAAAPSLKDKVEALIHKHFPALDVDGVEAHQPHRNFLLDLLALLP